MKSEKKVYWEKIPLGYGGKIIITPTEKDGFWRYKENTDGSLEVTFELLSPKSKEQFLIGS